MTVRRNRALAVVAALALAGAALVLVGALGGSAGATRDAARSARRYAPTSAGSPQAGAAHATGASMTRTRPICRWRRFSDGAISADPRCASGELDPVVRGRLAQTVCNASWVAATSKRLPSASTKNRLLIDYALPGNPVMYVIARVVPVQDGGSPTSARNLYPLPLNGFGAERTRAEIAQTLHDRICSHEITVAQAAWTLEGDWLSHGLPDDD
jgi:hypothetical protein